MLVLTFSPTDIIRRETPENVINKYLFMKLCKYRE
jgi:hypothetical protein